MYFKNIALCCAGILSINVSNAHTTISNGPFQHPVEITCYQTHFVKAYYLEDQGTSSYGAKKGYKHYYEDSNNNTKKIEPFYISGIKKQENTTNHKLVYDYDAYKNYTVPEDYNDFSKYIKFYNSPSTNTKIQFFNKLNLLYEKKKEIGCKNDFITKFNKIVHNTFGPDWFVYYNITEDFSNVNKELIIKMKDENGKEKKYIPVFSGIPFDKLILGKCKETEVLKGKNQLTTCIKNCFYYDNEEEKWKNHNINKFSQNWYNYISPGQFDIILSNGKNTIQYDIPNNQMKVYNTLSCKKCISPIITHDQKIIKTFNKMCKKANKEFKNEQKLIEKVFGSKCIVKYYFPKFYNIYK